MMRFWIYIACCLLASGVFSKSLSKSIKEVKASKRSDSGCCSGDAAPACCATSNELTACCDDKDEEEEDDEPKRLVVYFNFEKVLKHGRISDKSGYENSGTMTPGGEILKFNDKDYTCNQAARLWDHDIILRGDTFQAKPKTAITIAAWIKMEEHAGQHSIFDTVGTSHAQGQFHFEVNDGVARWFHRDEKQKVVFETMAHTVAKGKWVHVAGTYDSKTKQAKVFINGEIRNQSLGDGALSRDWGVRAGIGNKEKNRPLRGSIDEFRIYNYALKPDEIKALVSACKATAPDAGGASLDTGGVQDTAQKSEDAPAPVDQESKADDSGGATGTPGGSNNGDTPSTGNAGEQAKNTHSADALEDLKITHADDSKGAHHPDGDAAGEPKAPHVAVAENESKGVHSDVAGNDVGGHPGAPTPGDKSARFRNEHQPGTGEASSIPTELWD